LLRPPEESGSLLSARLWIGLLALIQIPDQGRDPGQKRLAIHSS
jgi:hypothetical protein